MYSLRMIVGMVMTLIMALGQAFSATSAMAQQIYRPNLLVLIQDDDRDTTPARNKRIMSRVVGGMKDYLHAKGYNVFDETAITQEFTIPSDRRRARAQLVDLVRHIKNPPIDAVLVIKLYASAERSQYNPIYHLKIRLEGDFLNMRTGQFIGHFEVENVDRPVLPAKCDRDCILEEVGKHAKVLGKDLARAMEAKLAGFLKAAGVTPPSEAKAGAAAPATTVTITTTPQTGGATGPTTVIRGPKPACQGFPMAYTITFEDFDTREQRIIEEFLNAFSCLQNIRALPSTPSRFAYWYESSAKDTVLARNLRTMLDYMNVTAQVNIAGSKILVKKVMARR